MRRSTLRIRSALLERARELRHTQTAAEASLSCALLLWLVTACAARPAHIPVQLDRRFREQIGVADLNESLVLTAEVDTARPPRFGSDVSILLVNLSTEQVLLPDDLGLRLFIVRQDAWIEIANGNEYYAPWPPVILRAPPETESRLSSWVRALLPPTVDATAGPELVRRLVLGESIPDAGETGAPIGAYVDVLVYP
jgi:hypothetical protein